MKRQQFMIDIATKFPGLLLTNVACLILMSVLDAVAVLFIAPVVDLFLNPQIEAASALTRYLGVRLQALRLPLTLTSALVIFLSFNVLKSAAHIVARYLILRTKYAVLRDLWLGTFEDFFRARWSFFTAGAQGTFLNTFIREMSVVGDAFGAMALFFANVLQFALYLAVPMVLSWQVTVISLLAALLFAWPFALFGRINYRLGQRNTATANALGAVIQESLGTAKIILGFNKQRDHLRTAAHAFDAHRHVTLRSQTLNVALPLLYYPLGLIVLVIAVLTSRRFGVPLSEAAVLFYALLKIIPSVGGIVQQKNSLLSFFPSYEQVLALRQRATELAQRSGPRSFTGFQRQVTFEHVTFAYPGRPPAIHDVSLAIPKARMTAIVGESGAGKSTIIDLMMGFHEPAAGRILIDGIPLEVFDVWSYRERIGYVPQESVLFHATIRENLRWASEGASDAELERACRLANAHGFIEELPERYDTIVGDRGVRLSGGQIQRIALARALLRRPEVLVLDEATSALDTLSERLIQQALEAIARQTTVVVVAHRLSTIVKADYVYVLREGRVVEEGTYQDLVEREGSFTQMVKLQVLEGPAPHHAETPSC